MPKNVEKMSTNYSPNFDLAKRAKKNIKSQKNRKTLGGKTSNSYKKPVPRKSCIDFR